ncbi:DUF2550 family protein [Cellulomonas sp. NPDC089187]|uniref:DUF2550 family protein n=1 Tax=Cellulomonas sp. NPDC089187 TaxID=3154970 RepID=UPI003432B3B5
MSGVHIALIALFVVVALLAVGGVAFSRWHTLTRRVGSFSCAVRAGGRLVPGVAHYGARSLYWFTLRSLSFRARRTWARSALSVLERTPLQEGRPGSPLLVRCRVAGGPVGMEETVDLVMSREAYAGLTSWLEAGPTAPHLVI